MAAWHSRSWSEVTGEAIARLDRARLIAGLPLREAHRPMCVAASGYSLGLPEGLFSARKRQHGIRAGDVETPVQLALAPQTVKRGRARSLPSLIEDLARESRFLPSMPGGDRSRLRARCRTVAGIAGVRPAASEQRARVEVTTGQPLARRAAARCDDPLDHRVRRRFHPGEPVVSTVVEATAFVALPR